MEKVDSCFGGFTFYRRIPFIYSKYFTHKKSYIDKNVICEHVGFHSTFGNLYSNNNMLLLVGELDVGIDSIKCEEKNENY